MIPILAQLRVQEGARFSALRGHLGMSRDALTSTLRYVIDQGWVQRAEGYGHPLRPEYLLTSIGETLSPPCQSVVKRLVAMEVLAVGLKKWSLPIIGAVGGLERFSEIRNHLQPITPRALSKGLEDLTNVAVVRRNAAGYALTAEGASLLPPLRDLARSVG